ncbi:hypothetical protein JCM10908_003347 [Rhodotorula pacifica]|uniref:uncharacterized protein n=1 Tax=Rhodotorula pacifica TaxID=1495444 RepID=UPI003174D017
MTLDDPTEAARVRGEPARRRGGARLDEAEAGRSATDKTTRAFEGRRTPTPRRRESTGSSKGKERALDPPLDEEQERRRDVHSRLQDEQVGNLPATATTLGAAHGGASAGLGTDTTTGATHTLERSQRAGQGDDEAAISSSSSSRSTHPVERIDPPVPPTPPPPPLDESHPPSATAPIALQSILKRPAPARLSSSSNSRFSYGSATGSPLLSIATTSTPSTIPSSATAPPAVLPAMPTLTSMSSDGSSRLAPPSPETLVEDDKAKLARPGVDTHGVLFSTPGTTTSVLPLSSPSLAESQAFHLGQLDDHGPADPTGTFKSWKSSMMGRRSGMYDRKKLAALGFEEELTRDYDFWASWGIALCNIGGLPGCTLGVLTALEAGGGSMYAIAWPISGLFMVSLAAILGEMASTWPVAGAMFTWVFRLCRSRKALNPWARYASWIVGSLLLCSHLLLQIVVTWQFAHNIMGVVGLYTEREYSHWVAIALGWGIATFSALVVCSRLSRSPWLWRICGYLIVAFFLIINVIILSTAKEIRSAKYVFTSYHNSTGFHSKSYVYMIGWVLTCVATGMEASAHMAEDTKKPSRTVPLAMFWSVLATYLMGWVSICVLLATMNAEGLDPALQPSIALIANSIPRAHTMVILVLVLFSLLFQNVAQLLATSRFIWALSRESALPFSNFFRRLSKKNKTPVPAIVATWAIVIPAICLIAINVSILATTMLEGAGITATSSYLAPILIYLACSSDVLRGDGRAQWTLRALSQPLCIPVVVFLGTFIIVMCLPTAYPITSLSVSYASAVLIGVLLLSSISWVVYGNRHYAGPIKTMTRWTIGAEVDLPSTSSAGGGVKKSTAANGHATTTAHLGRSAHVWATSGDYAADGEHDTGETGQWTDGTASRAMGDSFGQTRTTSTSGTGTETGSEEYTTDDDDEEEDETDSEEGHADGEASPAESRAARTDEEGRLEGRR